MLAEAPAMLTSMHLDGLIDESGFASNGARDAG
jgi:hypothetical protein